MKTISILFLTVSICAFASCESTNPAPPVTNAMAANLRTGKNVDLATLQNGRALFVHRCIECHTLPQIARYSAKQWPGLVDEMAPRADLKPGERDAIVAYILAARAQTK